MSAGLYLDRLRTSSSRRWIFGIISLLLLLFSVLLFKTLYQHPVFPQIEPALGLTRIDGTRQRIDGFRGKPLLVSFWSPSCAICMHEVNDFNRLYHAFGGGSRFELLAISMYSDRPDQVLKTSRDRAMQYPVYLDLQNEISAAFDHVIATPTSFLLDAEGNVVYRHVGALDFALLEQKLDELTG